jgi:titin
VTSFAFARDNGPNTDFLPSVIQIGDTYMFEGLAQDLMYKIKVAAINSIGQGEWSDTRGFYATSAPANPESFRAVSQSTNTIELSWEKPSSNGGCAVAGYRILMEAVDSPGFTTIYNGIARSY